MGAESTDGYETDVTNAQRAFVAGAVARLTSTRQRYTVQCCTYLLLTVLTYYDYNESNRLSILTVHDIIPALSQCISLCNNLRSWTLARVGFGLGQAPDVC